MGGGGAVASRVADSEGTSPSILRGECSSRIIIVDDGIWKRNLTVLFIRLGAANFQFFKLVLNLSVPSRSNEVSAA